MVGIESPFMMMDDAPFMMVGIECPFMMVGIDALLQWWALMPFFDGENGCPFIMMGTDVLL